MSSRNDRSLRVIATVGRIKAALLLPILLTAGTARVYSPG